MTPEDIERDAFLKTGNVQADALKEIGVLLAEHNALLAKQNGILETLCEIAVEGMGIEYEEEDEDAEPEDKDD